MCVRSWREVSPVGGRISWTRSRRSVLVAATWWSSSTARDGRFPSRWITSEFLQELVRRSTNESGIGLLQLSVLGFGGLIDGDVGVGLFPQSEEVFVVTEGAHAGGIGIGARRVLYL